MAILQAIFLGIIEGLTEFLPVSSTGHLIVAEKLIGYHDVAELFTVVIQVGALAAVIWFYRHDLLGKVNGLFGRHKQAVNFWRNWIVATIPAAAVGMLVNKHMDALATVRVVAWALIIGGVIIWLIETYHKTVGASQGGSTKSTQGLNSKPQAKLNELSIRQAIQVGMYQVLALIPGVSRSGATIMGGLLSGLDRVTATAFSFYLSLPILFLASAYKLYKGRTDIPHITGGGPAIIVGTLAAFVAAFLVVGWLLRYVSHHNFKPFAYYRILLGIVLLLFL